MSPPVSGTLHTYSTDPVLTAFEHATSVPQDSKNVVLFVAGLGDAPFLGVAYTPLLAEAVGKLGWSFAQVQLFSAGGSFGGSTVAEDAQEWAAAVKYFKGLGKDKVVIMGHSTGCQDAVAYAHQLLRSSVRSVTATILQAPVSDREFVAANMPDVPAPLNPPEGATLDDFVPADLSQRWGAKAGVTYRRWNSLTAKPEGDEVDLDTSEDVFSSDLSDARWRNVFAPFDAPVLVLLGDKDHSYPSGVEPSKLLERFRVALGEERFSKDSVVLKGANHAVEGEAARKVMIETIGRFLQAL